MAELSLVAKMLPAWVLYVDREQRVRFVNRADANVSPLPAEAMLGMHVRDVLGPDTYDERRPFLERALAGEELEHDVVRPPNRHGVSVVRHAHIVPDLDEGGAVRGCVILVTDITERRELEESLRESEERFRQLASSSHEGVVVHDRGAILFVNETAEKMFGYDEGELEGRSVLELTPPERREAVLANGGSIGGEAPVELDALRKDGTTFSCLVTPKTSRHRGRDVRVVVLRDLTRERAAKELEARLAIADRMASIGTLAAGAAHEINNPLAAIMTNLAVLAEDLRALASVMPLERAKGLDELVSDTRDCAERIRRIVGGLGAFSGALEERRATIDVRRVLDAAIDVTSNEMRHRARLVRDYGDTPLVEADEGQLAQAFVNILVNATQAIGEGHSEENEIRVTTRTDSEGRAVVEIRDTGVGIAPDVIGRVFDPFFTTKAVGSGTGLGLSICHGIVTSLGGHVFVESEQGHGALFRVVLPATSAPEASIRAPASRRGGRTRVLLVDDDVTLGASLGRVLRAHDVVVAHSGKAALALFDAGDEFDVVLCDVMMPEMSGMDLYAELERRFPEQAERVVFLTGGAFTPAARTFLATMKERTIEKPFDVAELRAFVQKLAR